MSDVHKWAVEHKNGGVLEVVATYSELTHDYFNEDYVSACRLPWIYPPDKEQFRQYAYSRWSSRTLGKLLDAPSSRVRHWLNPKSTEIIPKYHFDRILELADEQSDETD